MAIKEVYLPDLGSDDAEVIEILISVGDTIGIDQETLVLETDKASVEVPSSERGVVKEIYVNIGDQVAEGVLYMSVETSADQVADDSAVEADNQAAASNQSDDDSDATADTAAADDSAAAIVENTYQVPDLGTDQAEVIEVLVKVGEQIEEGDTIVVLETDKASVEVPSEASGEITQFKLSVGDNIVMGDELISIKGQQKVQASAAKAAASAQPASSSATTAQVPAKPAIQAAPIVSSGDAHAGPAVRQLARQLGVDLGKVAGTGPRNRILQEDLHAHVKALLTSGNASQGSAIPAVPAVDYEAFGKVSYEKMSRMHKATAANMLRSWLNVPHVTQFDDADITDLETHRASLKPEMQTRDIKVTPVAFLIKAIATALLKNPKFNAALHPDGQQLIQRQFIHIGMAVATDVGLVVPVIRDVDKKDVWAVAEDIASMAGKARDGKLKIQDMQGGCFSISSLGAIGGTGFTPIVNSPEVGIMGVSKSQVMPQWDGEKFIPRTMLPLSLSYDHRVINGADAGKFLTDFVSILSDISQFEA